MIANKHCRAPYCTKGVHIKRGKRTHETGCRRSEFRVLAMEMKKGVGAYKPHAAEPQTMKR